MTMSETMPVENSKRRQASTKKYLLAFVLTLLVFIGGILLGVLFENARLKYSEQIILQEKVNLRSVQLQQKYIDSGFADCQALNTLLDTNIDELGKKVAEVIQYDKNSVFNQEQFNLQLQDYFLTEMQFLFAAEEIDQKCQKTNIKIIYFYDENEFDTQGDILDYLKKLFGGRILIFSFNSQFTQEPMIPILLASYNITTFPSVVVEGQVLRGHTSVEELLEIVCEEFVEMDGVRPKECGEEEK